MSVLIKDMDMPDDCGKCHFCHTEHFHQWCCLTDETISSFDVRHFMCPLAQPEQRSFSCGQENDAPSVQPELIRCKDCKLFGKPRCAMAWDDYDWAEPDGYCHLAERREEGDE